jgi:hypothetical protein
VNLTLEPEARLPRHRLPHQLPTDLLRPARPLPAREYAEAWYQCLREPQTHVQPAIISTGTGGTFAPDLDVGQWRSGGGQTYVATPAGFRDERAIGRAVYDMLGSNRPDDVLYGKLLGRVITGVSISSLLREDGTWHRNRESAIRYGLACLTLAVQVRDAQAERPLAELRRELAGFA